MKNMVKAIAIIGILLLITGIAQVSAAGFSISGRNLIDANGNTFKIRGIAHAHCWYTDRTPTAIANIKTVGANAVRIVCSNGREGWTPTTASDLTTIINTCKTNRLICIPQLHDTTGYGEASAATSLAAAASYWNSVKSALTGQEAYVIINIGNEPYGNTNAGNWVAETKSAIQAMRNNGFTHTLMVDAGNWGQDWQFYMRDNAASIFAADTQKNTILSVHMYGVFDTAAEITSYIDTFKSLNLPLVIGEFGNMHSDGDPDEATIMSYSQSNGVGWMAWSWSGNGGGVEYLDMVTSFDINQKTSWGNLVFTGANGLSSTSTECSVFSGQTSPPAVTDVPTTAPTTPPGTVTAAPTDTPAPTSIPTATPAGVTADPTAAPGDTIAPTNPPATGCTCTNLCSSQTSISVPFTKDGAGEFCYVSTSLGSYVNSWNCDAVNVNGTSCTNTYVSSSSIAAISGNYYIYYKGSYSWSHLEIK